MARKIAMSNLNATTYDILNTIRANSSQEYQSLVPEVQDLNGIRKVGDVLYGYPALANQFISALVNRIALVRVKGATFNNAYKELKKGYLEFGETVEEVFVNIAKVRVFSPEKAEQREHKRSLPDVKTAFHIMNWRVQYPVTIQDEDLRMAFMSVEGVQEMIAKIVDSVYTAAEYDEYLLFKYLMIKAIAKGKMCPVKIDTTDMNKTASMFRGTSNDFTFMKTKYNSMGVTTTTPKERQYIFMDSFFNAQFDVEVLARAFNMDKADFTGKLKLIDNWCEFDNERFAEIFEECDNIEEVTDDELALLKNVKAVLLDSDWFQVYDNQNKFTEKYVASGEYWNYFYNVWKTVSSSPFSNAVVFVTNDTVLDEFDVTVSSVIDNENTNTRICVLECDYEVTYEQTQSATEKCVGVQQYGALIFDKSQTGEIHLIAKNKATSKEYHCDIDLSSIELGTTLKFTD